MPDIVDYALDQYTDHKKFEKLACEIMREYGYYSINPLGGVADDGSDADHIPLYYSEDFNIKTVFHSVCQRLLWQN